MLRGDLPGQTTSGIEAILERFRTEIVSKIQKALQEANKPIEINSSQRINISRDLLQKPILQEDGSFLSQSESLLKSIREAYSENLNEDQLEWVDESTSDWKKILEDMEHWELYVDFQAEVHPEIEQASFEYSVPESGPFLKVDTELQLDPLIRMKSVHLVLENPVTGEVFSLGDPTDFQADLYLSNTIEATSSLELDLNLNESDPLKAKIDPVQTNILPSSSSSEGILIRSSDVDSFMKKLFNQDRVKFLLSQALPGFQEEGSNPVSSTRIFGQIESDITNYLRYQNLEVSLLLLETSDGKLKTDALILTSERKQEIQKAYQDGKYIDGNKIIGEFRSVIPLELNQSHLRFDHESQSFLLDFDFLKSKPIRWSVEFFETSTALLGGELNSPLLQSIFEKIRLDQDNLRGVEIEADIEFSLTNSGFQIEIPLDWQDLDSSGQFIPQISLEDIQVTLPALSEATIQELRLRSDKNLEWLRIKLNSGKKISDQLYAQVHSIIKNINHLLQKNTVDQISSELSTSLIELLKLSQIDISTKPVANKNANAITSGTLQFVNFPLDLNAIHFGSVNPDDLSLLEEFGLLFTRNETFAYSKAFDSLPQRYQNLKDQEAVYRFHTEIDMPKTIGLRIDNFENSEAKVERMEFNLTSKTDQHISIYWKLVQNTEGRMILIPEFHNLKHVLKSYRPVTEGSIAEGGPLIQNIIAKNPTIQSLEATTLVGNTLGSALSSSSKKGLIANVGRLVWGGVGKASGLVSSEVESAKRSRLRNKLSTDLISSAIKEVDPLILFTVDLSSGYLDSKSAKSFSLPHFQSLMEQSIEAQLDYFKLRNSLGEILLENETFLEKAKWKLKAVVESVLLGQGPFST